MNLGIAGKVALVVGASKSIGRAVAEALVHEGAYVIAVARSSDELASLALEGAGVGRCYALDLMPEMNCQRLVNRILADGQAPDIIYYAIGGSVDGIRDTASHSSAWARVWRFNLGIAIDLNNAFIPAMRAKKWGRIVMTSSDATKCNSGNVPYTSSKFALEGYVKVASKQFAKDNVIISAVSPGPIYTEGRPIYSQSPEDTEKYFDKYLPIRRFGQAEEVAKTVAFLCSEHAAFMPGAIVDVHGGSR
jgi:NAD(P)-dependent dehydrogenase (short-subunit alcohol dehydrogenase family)